MLSYDLLCLSLFTFTFKVLCHTNTGNLFTEISFEDLSPLPHKERDMTKQKKISEYQGYHMTSPHNMAVAKRKDKKAKDDQAKKAEEKRVKDEAWEKHKKEKKKALTQFNQNVKAASISRNPKLSAGCAKINQPKPKAKAKPGPKPGSKNRCSKPGPRPGGKVTERKTVRRCLSYPRAPKGWKPPAAAKPGNKK